MDGRIHVAVRRDEYDFLACSVWDASSLNARTVLLRAGQRARYISKH